MSKQIVISHNGTQPATLREWQDIELAAGTTLTKVGIQFAGYPSFDQWQAVGLLLAQFHRTLHFWIGDWINYGQHRWGERYSQAIDVFGYAYGTLANDAMVCRRIEFSRRREELTFAHHQAVARLPSAEQDELLASAVEFGWTVADVRDTVRARQRESTRAAERITRKLLGAQQFVDDAASEAEPNSPQAVALAQAQIAIAQARAADNLDDLALWRAEGQRMLSAATRMVKIIERRCQPDPDNPADTVDLLKVANARTLVEWVAEWLSAGELIIDAMKEQITDD